MPLRTPLFREAFVALSLCAALFATKPALGQVIFVDQTSTCTAGCGASWADAYSNLQDALSSTDTGEIWVARGAYRPVECSPCTTTDRQQPFYLKRNVALYGGFAGTESSRQERDIEANPTILSGDIGAPIDSTDNAFRVLIADNTDSTTLLDGFIIEEGNADGPFGFSLGGGLFIDATGNAVGDLRIRNCIFRNNYATGGGAIGMDGSGNGTIRAEIRNCRFEGNSCSLQAVSRGAAAFITGSVGATIEPKFIGCTFRNNYSGDDGGALALNVTSTVNLNRSSSAVLIDSCLFENNTTEGAFGRGGAIWMLIGSNTGSQNVIQNSRFLNNTSGGHGGAIFNRASFDLSQADDRILHCIFSGNRSMEDGGALYFRGSQGATNTGQAINCTFLNNQAALNGGAVFSTSFASGEGITQNQLLNCSFYGNTALQEGGAVYLDGASGGINGMEINNCILWNDSAGAGENEIRNNGGSAAASHCIIEQGLPPNVSDEGNNIAEDPQYADAPGGDLHLPSCSPGVDAGSNAIIPPFLSFDLDGERRIENNNIDIGAYESARIFVDLDAVGNNNGASWADAFTDLQDALKVAYAGDQVWVAEGIYRPSSCNPCSDANRETAFMPRSNVELYGGFAGVEDELDQRDYEANLTVLSGDIGAQNDSTDNAYRVVILENTQAKTIVDGFTIEEGNADGSFGFAFGGGIYIKGTGGRASSPLIRNCTIRNNYASGGGGIGMDGSGNGTIEAEIRNCLFEGNTCSFLAVSRGAAVFVTGSVGANLRPKFVGCTFRNNFSGDDGGAIAINVASTEQLARSYSAVQIDSCLFEANRTQGEFGRGGAIWILIGSNTSSQNVIRNSRFLNNIAGGNGGAIFNRASFALSSANDQILNCFFSGNRSLQDGGALYFRGSQQATNNGQAINCVFINNQATLNGGAAFSTAFSTEAGTARNKLIHCSFYNNTAQQQGGAVYIDGTNGGMNEMAIQNSILWENNAMQGGKEAFNNGGGLSLSHCIIQDGYNGTGTQEEIQTADPLFLNPNAEDLGLSPCSPAVNAGSNVFLPIDAFDLDNDQDSLEILGIDLAGNNRIFEDIADLGALEWNGLPVRLDTVEAQVADISCFGRCDGQIQALPVGGIPGYTFLWSTGDTASTLTGLCANTYRVTVTDGSGCQDSIDVLLEESELLQADAGLNSAVCAGTTVTLSASATGGDGNYSYAWSNGLGDNPQATATPMAPTEYVVEVTDGRNCIARDTVLIQVVNNPQPTISGDTSFCEGQGTTLETGAFETYLWSTGDTTSFIVIDEGGTYSVTVADELGCTGQASFEANPVETPAPQVTGSLSFCFGGSTTLDAGQYENYLWSTGDFTQTITVNTEGSITVTVVNDQGCTGQATVQLTERPELTPEVSGSLFLCSGASTLLDVGAYESYLWSTGDTTQTLSVNRSGIFSVTVTDEFGCTGTASVQTTQNPSIVPAITGELFICPGSTTVLNAGLYNGYQWSTGDTTQTITVDTGGIFTVIVSDELGCTGQTSELVTQSASPMPQISGQFSFCPGASTTLDAGTFNSFLWSTGDTTQTISVDTEGTYSLTVTDEQGCTGETAAEVSQGTIPIPVLDSPVAFCSGGSATLDAGTFDSYLWSTGDTTQTISVTAEGAYSVTVTNAQGCSGVASTEAVESESLMPEITGQPSFCSGSSTTLDAGTFDSYLWSTGDTTQTISVNVQGDYSVTVFDGQGCTGETSAAVAEIAAPTPQVDGQLSFCAGAGTTLDAGPFEHYLWSTGDTTQTILASTAGTYSVTVSNEQGCSGEAAVTVTQSAAPMPQITGPLALCTGASTTLNAGTFESYLWSTGAVTSSITIDAVGSYSVTVTNEQGCSGEAAVEVAQGSAPEVRIIASTQSVCAGESLELLADGEAAFSWLGPAGTLETTGPASASVSPQTTAIYYLIGSNDCGADTASIEISVLPAPEVTLGEAPRLRAGETFSLLASGASRYEWAPARFLDCSDCPDPIVAPDSSITYTVIGIDENGCRDTASLFIEVLLKEAPLIDPVNTITPNGDGVNDFFVIPELEFYPDHKLSIFNRWGDVVYESRDYQGDWDGTYKGKELPAGTYLYVLVVEISGEPVAIRKTITIIRE